MDWNAECVIQFCSMKSYLSQSPSHQKKKRKTPKKSANTNLMDDLVVAALTDDIDLEESKRQRLAHPKAPCSPRKTAMRTAFGSPKKGPGNSPKKGPRAPSPNKGSSSSSSSPDKKAGINGPLENPDTDGSQVDVWDKVDMQRRGLPITCLRCVDVEHRAKCLLITATAAGLVRVGMLDLLAPEESKPS